MVDGRSETPWVTSKAGNSGGIPTPGVNDNRERVSASEELANNVLFCS